MLPQIETMKYGGSDLMLSPALEEFVLHMTGKNEQGIEGYNNILFRKTVITDTWVQHGDGATMTMTPILDAYFFFDSSKVADAVVTMGVFKAEYDGGQITTGTFQRPVWVKDYDLLGDDYLIEYFRYVQHTIVNDKELALLLEPVDTCKQWCPVILEGQRRGEFREGNPDSLCVAIFGAIQGIAQEKVRIPNTPLPEIDWLMDMIVIRTQ